MMDRSIRICLLVLASSVLLAGCVSMPSGPSVMTLPGTGKTFDQFRFDESECRQYAASSVGGTSPDQAQADSGVKSAVLGTVVGAAAGAAAGGHESAGAGAAAGLVIGALAGSAAGTASGYELQHRYDIAYIQCMYAKGNRVPSAGHVQRSAPAYSYPAAPPGYYYPPPPPGYPPVGPGYYSPPQPSRPPEQ
jgi:hypothetical protein